MSLEKIIQCAINNDAIQMQEAFEEEITERVRDALEEKYKKMMKKEDEEEDEEDEEDEDEEC
jgi:hypothetical protein